MAGGLSGSKGSWHLLGRFVVVVGGTVLVSHAANQIARDSLAIAIGVIGGLILAGVISQTRSVWPSRQVDRAAVGYLIALSLVSLSLDWFDPRGVIPAGVLETVALLRPLPSSGGQARVAGSPNRVSATLISGILVMLAGVLLWLAFGPSPDQTLWGQAPGT
jgi:hypothetical protein